MLTSRMGSGDEIIDIEQEIYDSFDKEQMLAYFDFTIHAGGLSAQAGSISGLCKVSKPKEGKTTYFSTIFIIDVPDAKTLNELSTYVMNIDWDGFKNHLPGFDSIMIMPNSSLKTDFYLIEADIFIDRQIYTPKEFVLHKLYPSIEKVTGFKPGGLVFWDDFKSQDTEKPPLSLFQKIKGALNIA